MDIDINEWLEENQRFSILSNQISQSINLLRQSSCLQKVLYYWVRHEVINQYKSDFPDFANSSDQSVILEWSLRCFNHRLNENFLEKKDGLVHISELADKRVGKVTDVVKEGDEVKVKVIGFDRGKVKLSIKQAAI